MMIREVIFSLVFNKAPLREFQMRAHESLFTGMLGIASLFFECRDNEGKSPIFLRNPF